MVNNSPLFLCDELPNIGGFFELRLAYSQDILQQNYQSESEIERLVFLEGEKYISSWNYAENFSGQLKIESAIGDFGTQDDYAFKAILEVDTQPAKFKEWYNNQIRNRRLALELTSNNEIVRVLNPFEMKYTYIGTDSFENLNRYELTFQRTRMVDNYLDLEDNDITSVDVVCPTFSGGFNEGFEQHGLLEAGAYLKLKINAPNLYRFGYSLSSDVLKVSNWQSSTFFRDIPENPYYFFAENLFNPFAPILSKKAIVFCGDLVFEIVSMVEEIVDNYIDPNWEDFSTTYEDLPDFAILAMTEMIIATDNPLENDWTDVSTIAADFAIMAMTEQIL